MINSIKDIQNLFLNFRKDLLQQGFIEPKTPQEMAFLFDCFVNLADNEKNEFDEKFKNELFETGKIEPKTTKEMAWVFGMIDIELRDALSHEDDVKEKSLKIITETPVLDMNDNLEVPPKIDDYKYLKELSEPTQKFIISKIESENKNLYLSVMSVLTNKVSHRTLQDVNTEVQSYIEKHKINKEYLVFIKELFELCYKKIDKNKKPRNKSVRKKK